MPTLHFHYEEVEFRLNDPLSIQNWVLKVIKAEGFLPGEINYIFCSDSYLLDINLSYLKHDTLTDIVTFDQSEDSGVIEADIFISIDRVEENASELEINFNDELHRVIIHGILHLIGYQDKSDAQKKEMRKKEEACLSLRAL